MGFWEWVERREELTRWRRVRGILERIEANPGAAWVRRPDHLVRGIPAAFQTKAERREVKRLPEPGRRLARVVIESFAQPFAPPGFVVLAESEATAFGEFIGVMGVLPPGFVKLRIAPSLANAPESFVRYMAAYAVMTAPGYVLSAIGAGISHWPSRSAMAGIRKQLSAVGDWPGPVDWALSQRTLQANAYFKLGHDRLTRQLAGVRLTEEAIRWADAQPHPHYPGWYPSWRGRFAVQEHEAEIWRDGA